MNKVSLKKIVIVFIVIFILSRSRAIVEFLTGIDFNLNGILTLEPLRQCSEEDRYVVTLLFLAFCFVVLWKLLLIFKSKKKEGTSNKP